MFVLLTHWRAAKAAAVLYFAALMVKTCCKITKNRGNSVNLQVNVCYFSAKIWSSALFYELK